MHRFLCVNLVFIFAFFPLITFAQEIIPEHGAGVEQSVFTGNITKIKDTSMHNGSKTLDFEYDDLYRLTRASSTVAKTGSNYIETYSYDKLGNILNKSDIGQYLYQGHQGSSYANPHAVTSVNNKTYTYDNNGNLTNNQEWAFTWDYNNRLTQTASSTATSTYKYDHTEQRVRLDNGTNVIHYPNKYYNISYLSPFPNPSPSPTPTPVNITKHIYANGKTIATIDGYSAKKTFMNHSDHLGGSNVISDKYGRLEELTDYYPFGDIRINQSGENSFKEQRKFTGHEYDTQTELTYMGARYYPGDNARFLSQDPAFLAVGSPEFENIADMKLQRVLRAPQLLNSYSYAINNPLRIIDPDGQWFKEFLTGQQSRGSFQVEVGDAANYLYDNSAGWKAAMDHPIATGAVVGVGSGLAAYAGAAGITAGVAQIGLVGGTQADKAVNVLNDSSNILSNSQRQMINNTIENKTLQNIFNSLYKAKDKYPCGTAGAVRIEEATGKLLSPSGHLEKAQNSIRGLEKILQQNVSKGDQQIGNQLLNNLKNTIDKK